MNETSIFNAFKQATLLILTPRCFDAYFIENNILDVDCFKSTLSKCLGLGIVLGSIMVKLPQIMKIFNSKSGKGINLYSVSLDLSAITIYMSYSFVKGFPFSSYGDSMFLAVQTLAIPVLVLIYNGSTISALSYLLSYLVISYVMMFGITPVDTLWTLQTFNIFLVVVGKLLQAWTNYRNGNTGQLSAVTLFMLFAGSAARIFTSVQETGDFIVILTYIASTLANAVLVVQLLYYWNVKDKTE